MKNRRQPPARLAAALLAALLVALAPAAFAEGKAPTVDRSATSRDLDNLARVPLAQRPYVSIYEVRSGVSEIDPRSATEMFTTALIKSRQFRVVERQRIEQGVGRERNLNGQGITGGNAASVQLAGASFVFEAAFSEANAGKARKDGGVSVGGMSIGGAGNTDEIGLDVRVVNAGTGEVVDAINVRKEIESSSTSVAGVGNLIDTVASLRGKSTRGLTPDANFQSSRKESVDRAMRSTIELAIAELSRRSREWIEESAPAAK